MTRSAPTRSLWVTNDFPPRPGGIEQFLGNLVALLDPGSVRVLASPWPDAEAHDATLPYRVDRVGRRPLLPTPALARTIRQAAVDHRADVVVFGTAWPLGELAGSLPLPSLALTMGHEAGMVRVGLGPVFRRVARKVEALTALSAFTREQLRPWVGGTRISDLFPGVDVEVFTPAVDGGPIRERHGIAGDQPLAVCVSRLVRRKGQDVLIEQWPQVRRRVPGAHLLLVGTGPLAGRLQARVRALGLEGAVTLTGAVPWEELPAHHAAADVFAMPCRTRWGGLDVEGLGIVYLEAQACGKPVVAGSSGGAPETMVHGETGLLVDGGDARAVADAVSTLLADPQRARAMGRAGRALVERVWSWQVVAAGLEQLLAEVARMPAPR